MSSLEQDESLSSVFWWKPPVDFKWMDFHQAMDDVKKLASEIQQPVIIVARPQGDLPKGNAIPHLSRLFNILKTSSAVQCFIVVLDSHHPVSKMLMGTITRVYGVPDNFVIVPTVEQAFAKIQTITS